MKKVTKISGLLEAHHQSKFIIILQDKHFRLFILRHSSRILSHCFPQFCAIRLVLFQKESYLWNMNTEKEILKENELTNIDELMDSQFGKPGTPERERFREEARTYVNGYAQTAECRNSQKKRK